MLFSIVSFLATIGLHAYVCIHAVRKRMVDRLATTVLIASGTLAVLFVWVHAIRFTSELAERSGEAVPGDFAKQLEYFLRHDSLIDYFGEFSSPFFQQLAARFWLNDVRNVTLVHFMLLSVEGARHDYGAVKRLFWVLFTFLGTLAGSLAIFAIILFRVTGEFSASSAVGERVKRQARVVCFGWPHALLLSALGIIVQWLYVSWTNDGVNVYMVLSLVVPLLPYSIGCSGAFERWHVLATFCVFVIYSIVDRMHGLFAIVASLDDGVASMPARLVEAAQHIYTAALANDVMFGTVSGECVNLAILAILFAAFQTRCIKQTLITAVLFFLGGCSASLAYAIVARELILHRRFDLDQKND